MKITTPVVKTLALWFVFITSISLSTPAQSYSVPSESDVLKNFGFPSQFALSKRMKILVWNLHKGQDDTFGTEFIELAYKKDLVLGQEMLLDSNMRLVFGSFPHYFYASATSFFIGDELTRTGLTTISPVHPESVNYVRTKTLEPILNSPKVTLVTRYPIKSSDKFLTVVNIHGINFVDNDSYRSEMNRVYDAIKSFPSPLIFAGDFNSWNEERNIALKDICQKLGLKEASFSPDYRMRFNKHPLDHFFFSADLKIIEAKVEDFYRGSDHKPLELIVEYLPPSTPSLKIAKTR
ncbi:MAG: endonuclease/exonuclease/phosphatase family protein [Bacteriovorax sp.]|jgi:endonuclease/exonuclease/phosphatase (EEP) superfamily protein YafD